MCCHRVTYSDLFACIPFGSGYLLGPLGLSPNFLAYRLNIHICVAEDFILRPLPETVKLFF